MTRHSTYDDNQAEIIIDGLASGLSMRSICRDNPSLPDRTTIIRWMHERPEFATRCARAREDGAEVHHDDMDDIEQRVLDGDLEPQAANVVLANKRWRLEKLKPRVFGSKLELHGPGGGAIPVSVDVSGLSDNTIAELMRARRSAETDSG